MFCVALGSGFVYSFLGSTLSVSYMSPNLLPDLVHVDCGIWLALFIAFWPVLFSVAQTLATIPSDAELVILSLPDFNNFLCSSFLFAAVFTICIISMVSYLRWPQLYLFQESFYWLRIRNCFIVRWRKRFCFLASWVLVQHRDTGLYWTSSSVVVVTPLFRFVCMFLMPYRLFIWMPEYLCLPFFIFPHASLGCFYNSGSLISSHNSFGSYHSF